MRGEVLHFDEAQGFGFITASDGNRYTFSREDLRREAPMSKGTQVEFQPSGSQARDVFSIRAQFGSAAAGPSIHSAASPVQAAPHFGRAGLVEDVGSTGLWGYFWRAMTVDYANFRSRARRKEYWGFTLFVILAGCFLGAVGGVINVATGDDSPDETSITTMVLVGVFIVAAIIPMIAVTVRRIHDIGLSGWFYLLAFVPYIGFLVILVFALIPSQKHENKWGAIPAGVRV